MACNSSRRVLLASCDLLDLRQDSTTRATMPRCFCTRRCPMRLMICPRLLRSILLLGALVWLATPPPGNIHRLSASSPEIAAGAEPATAELLLRRIADLPARPGDQCLIFLTSHGERGSGVWLARSNRALTPNELARALSRGCSAVPTVVIVSTCYSGSFATGKMAKTNRVILTAARVDPPSSWFGRPNHMPISAEPSQP